MKLRVETTRQQCCGAHRCFLETVLVMPYGFHATAVFHLWLGLN